MLASLRQLPYKAYHDVASAYQLVLDASTHGCSDFSAWQPLKSRLCQCGLSLYSIALQWHESLYAKGRSSREINDYLSSQGVKSPQRLMNIILPLPQADA